MGTYRELAEKGKGLEIVLENKEYSHGEYCHYTTLDTINKIIKGKSFMLGSVNEFNDDCDRNQFENPKQSFALCFATGVSENLPMWQIYAGCNLQGGRIQFTNSVHSIEKLVKDSKFEVWRKKEYIQRFESNRTNTYVPYILKDGEMYKAFHDVIYVREEGKNVSIKYNNRFITQIPKEMYKNYIESDIDGWNGGHNGFIKSNIWYFEKETRLLIKLKDGVLNKVKAHEAEHAYKAHEEDEFVISLNFENIYNDLIVSGKFQLLWSKNIIPYIKK